MVIKGKQKKGREIDFMGYRSLYDLFERSSNTYALLPFLYFMGKTYTYRDIACMVQEVASCLEQNYHIRTGNRVALCLPNCPYYIVYYYAALKLGAVVVNLNPMYSAGEMAYILEDADVDLLITVDTRAIASKVKKALHLYQSHLKKEGKEAEEKNPRVYHGVRSPDEVFPIRAIVCSLGDDMSSWKRFWYYFLRMGLKKEHLIQKGFLLHSCENDGPSMTYFDKDKCALLQYTSGTTGRPKAAELTHANLLANVIQIEEHFVTLRRGEECFMGVLPFFHVFSMTTVMNLAIYLGASIVLMPRFEAGSLVRDAQKYKVTIFPSVPTIFSKLSSSYGVRLRSFLESVHAIISGGAPLSPIVKERFEKHTKKIIREGYGLTETSPVLSCNPIDSEGKSGSVGLILPYTDISIRDINDSAIVCPQDVEGEICVKGPQVMRGYVGRASQERNEAHDFTKDGYFRTGDSGYIDEDGYLYVVDRLKDMILRNGYCVYPRRIEDVIRSFPGVKDVAVIGINHEGQGEVPKAFIVRRGKAFVEDDFVDFLKNELSPLEVPVVFDFVKGLPLNFLGKPDKKVLKKQEEMKKKI